MSDYAAAPARQPANRSLDVVRGLAAALVVLGHARNYLFEAVKGDRFGTGWQKIALAPTSFAVEAVGVFFVLSGLLVGGQVIRDVRSGRFSWPDFLVKRLTRLWVVLLPGLALTALWDFVSRHAAGSTFRLIHGAGNGSAGEALCNAVFLQRGRCASFGSNDALWSLGYEFWFYIVFAGAAVAVAAVTRRLPVRGLLGALAAVVAVSLFGWHLLLLIPAWLIGVAVAVAVDRWGETARTLPGGPAIVLSVLLLGAAMLWSNVARPGDTLRFLAIGAAAAPLIWVLACRRPGNDNRTVAALSRTGNWSFSSYVFHLPILKMLTALLAASLLRGAGGTTATFAVYPLAVVAYVATLPLWWATERNTNTVRRWVSRKLGTSPAPGQVHS